MKKFSIKHMVMVCSIFAVVLLTACGGNKPQNLLIGRWVSDENEIVEFREDGTCTAPFTYDAAWLESAERYTVKEDGTLVLSSTGGNVDASFRRAESEDDVLEYSASYFVSKDTFVIKGVKYTKTN